jgi:hypothetical protein
LSDSPYLIQFDQIGNPAAGYITTTQFAEKIPFTIKRVFWIHGTPKTVVRGNHANKLTEEVLIVLTGGISVITETVANNQTFELTTPDQGLYIPAMCWTQLCFQEGTVGLCLASTDFDDADYIRDHAYFKHLLSNSR